MAETMSCSITTTHPAHTWTTNRWDPSVNDWAVREVWCPGKS